MGDPTPRPYERWGRGDYTAITTREPEQQPLPDDGVAARDTAFETAAWRKRRDAATRPTGLLGRRT